MVVDELDVRRLSIRPTETDPPLIVDPDAVLACSAPLQLFESVPRRHTKIIDSFRGIQDEQSSERLTLNVAAPSGYSDSMEDVSGFLVRERANHDAER